MAHTCFILFLSQIVSSKRDDINKLLNGMSLTMKSSEEGSMILGSANGTDTFLSGGAPAG